MCKVPTTYRINGKDVSAELFYDAFGLPSIHPERIEPIIVQQGLFDGKASQTHKPLSDAFQGKLIYEAEL